MTRTILRILIFVSLGQISLALTGSQIKYNLSLILSPQAGIYLPSDQFWANETVQRFDAWSAPTYIVSVKPAVEEDVQTLIQFSKRNKIPVLVTGGGHGYSGSLGALQNGMEIDMSGFKNVSIDSANGLMTVGAGVRFQDFMDQLYAVGRAIRGGIGFYSSYFGAISDSLYSTKVILSNGASVAASEDENSDLFWAIKGAGANFGAAISMTYKVHESPNTGQVMSADMTFRSSQNRTLFEFAKSWVGSQPKELSIVYSVHIDPASQELVIIVNVIYAGSLSQGKSLIQPLLDLKPQNINISYIPWKDAPDVANYGAPEKSCHSRGVTTVPFGVNLYKLDVNGLSAILDFLNQSIATTPALQGSLFALTQYSTYGFKQFSSNSSAFPFRDVAAYA
ncbi:MAG: hypothetical protein Q9201_002478 [Fulgogasparrea decipioides]